MIILLLLVNFGFPDDMLGARMFWIVAWVVVYIIGFIYWNVRV